MQRLRRLALAAVAVTLVLTLVACGGSDDDEGATQPASTSPATTTGDSVVAESKANIEALYAGQAFVEPPAESPPPQRGKKIWQINVGLVLPGAALVADVTKEAAKEMGWDLTIYDAKLSVDKMQDGIQQAIAARADGILLYAIDCAPVQAALKQAKAANIPTVAVESLDCDEFEESPGPALFTEKVKYNVGDFRDWVAGLGKSQADWIIAQSEGKAKAIVFSQTDLQIAVGIYQAFRDRFAKCTTCETVEVIEFTSADMGPKLQQKAEQALVSHPDATAVAVTYDEIITAGVGSAILASGRNDELDVVAGGGFESNAALVRENRGQDAGFSTATSVLPWEAWALVDTMNRTLAGEPAENSGIGIAFFDREHNLGTSGPTPSPTPIDFAASYKKAWAAAEGS